jgi:hypothetical protein
MGSYILTISPGDLCVHENLRSIAVSMVLQGCFKETPPQKCILSQFEELQVQNQSDRRFFLLRDLRLNVSHAYLLASGFFQERF